MRIRLKPFPVLVACEGCPAHGQSARDVARRLDAAGLAEASWLGDVRSLPTVRAKVRSRYPVYALDACERGCARAWLQAAGASVQRELVLRAGEPVEAEAARLAKEL
ncbi:MAG TPA: putative zinc-binding protein [Burkholderiales bacterium]|nr:putative zinc-binding protein [Burkholderiales bacterium]